MKVVAEEEVVVMLPVVAVAVVPVPQLHQHLPQPCLYKQYRPMRHHLHL
jgi:hypothetical protein